ncbi:agmatine deiminase, partial [Halomonas sp. GDM18]
MATRLLAEWHPQDAIQLSWPSPHSDWSEMLASIEATCEAMVIAISRYQHVLIS